MKNYYAQYCPYGVHVQSLENRIRTYYSKKERDRAVADNPKHYRIVSAKSKAVRRHLVYGYQFPSFLRGLTFTR
jgi:KaiC/GvpD/RAD55 family RecA-like ATPase